MECKTDVMDSSKREGKRLLRTLELKAFRSVVDALRAQGSFNTRKCSVLKNLASTLKVGDERCRSEMRRAVNDNVLKSIAQCSEERNSDELWQLESARRVARVPMVNEPTVFTALANKVSDWVLMQHPNHVERSSTLIEILESKKCRTEANATRYHSAKLFRPLLTTSSKDAEQIAIELGKIKAYSKLSRHEIHRTKADSLPVAKPPEIPVQVEIPKTSTNTPAENVRLEEPLVVENHRIEVTVDVSPPEEAVEVPKKAPNKPRAAKKRPRSRPKRSQSAKKTNSLQEELSRTVNAVDALVTPVTEPSGAPKRPNDSLDTVTDKWQPKRKKSKIEAPKKVIANDEVAKSAVPHVRIDEMKSSAVIEDKNSSICNVYPTDDSIGDVSQETASTSHKSSVNSTQEEPVVPLEKDFTPHTFNLIPASRRLKMVKKKENSNGSLLKEQDLVVSADNREMQNSSVTLVELHFREENKWVDHKKVSGVPRVNDSVVSSGAVTKNGKVSSKETPFERKKEADEKLKHVLPVLSESKKTLSLLGNIKVLNLNAKAEDESPKVTLPGVKDEETVEIKVENDDEDCELVLDQSEIEYGSSVGSEEYSTFDDSDSHSVIEYWDHEDDEDIIENGNHLDCDDEDFDDSNSFEEVVDDLTDEASVNSEPSVGDIVEEIFEEEYDSDVVNVYESHDSEELIFNYNDSVNSTSRDGGENCGKIKPSISAEQPTTRKLIPKVIASNAAVLRSSSLIPNLSASNAAYSRKSDSKTEPTCSTKIVPLAAEAAVSILKLRKPDGTTAELAKAKEVVIVSPKLPKTVAINVKNEKSASPTFQMIPPAQCIVRGQTISLANARLIKAPAKTTNPSAVLAGGGTPDLPKITLYSAAKVPTKLPPSASRRATMPPSSKITSTGTPLARPASLKSSTLSIPKKVCRLYDLMDVSKPAFSNSSSKPSAKKNAPNKKPAVSVSST